jgi:hypothetical protein
MKILKTKLPQDKSVKLYVNIVFSVDIAKQNTPFVAFARMPSIQLRYNIKDYVDREDSA